MPRTAIYFVKIIIRSRVCGRKMWESLLENTTQQLMKAWGNLGLKSRSLSPTKSHRSNGTRVNLGEQPCHSYSVSASFCFFSFNHGTHHLISPDLFLNKILCTLTVYAENRRVNRSKRSELFEGKEMSRRRSFYRRVISALLQYLIWGYSFHSCKEKRFTLAAGWSAGNRLWASGGEISHKLVMHTEVLPGQGACWAERCCDLSVSFK